MMFGRLVSPPCPAMSTLQLQPMIAPLSCTTLLVTTAHQPISAQALLDSGLSGKILAESPSTTQPLEVNLSSTIKYLQYPGKAAGQRRDPVLLTHSALVVCIWSPSPFWCLRVQLLISSWDALG